MDVGATPEDIDAFLEGIRRWFVEDQGFLDVDALLESLDMTMEEFEVVARQENFPRTQVRGLGWGLWDPADIVKWRVGGERTAP